ncbi:MAG TPA: hypothetical protein VIM84_03030, partial [Gemmatimonadales bacterium]
RAAGAQEGARHRREAGADRDHLIAGLALAEDDLGVALAQLAVMVDARECDVFEGKVPQLLQRGLRRQVAGGYVGKKFSELLGRHAT